MESIEERLAALEKKVRHLEAENKRFADMFRLIHRLCKENQANIKEYVMKTLFSKEDQS